MLRNSSVNYKKKMKPLVQLWKHWMIKCQL